MSTTMDKVGEDANIGQRIAEVLGMTYTDSSLKRILTVLDAKNANGELTERNIRSMAEAEYLKEAQTIIDRLEPMYDSLVASGECIDRAADIDTKVVGVLDGELAKCHEFAQEAETLQKEKKALEAKLATVQTYRDLFQLQPNESEVLDSTTEPITQEFFDAFAKAKRIYADCHVLLADAPRAGEHAMTDVSKHLDNGYAKIKYALDQHLKTLLTGAHDGERSSRSPVRKYMALLSERPVLFKSVLSEVASVRRTALSSELQNVLPQHPQDSAVATLGALLAWVHASIVNEYENMALLIDPEIDEHNSQEETTTKSLSELLDTTDTRKIITEMVDSITGPALEAPLRQRVGALVLSQSDAPTIDELSGVLRFYAQLLTKYKQPTLLATLDHLNKIIERQFEHCLTTKLLAAKKNKSDMVIDGGCNPPQFWLDSVDDAVTVLKAFDQGVARESQDSAAVLSSHLNAILDPSLEECRRIAKEKSSNEAQGNIYLLNCLDVADTHLAAFISAVDKVEAIERDIDQVIALQAAVENKIMESDSGIDGYTTKGIDEAQFYEQFDLFLSSANIDLSKRLEHVASPTMADKIGRQAMAKLIEDYAKLAETLSNARPALDIKTLLM